MLTALIAILEYFFLAFVLLCFFQRLTQKADEPPGVENAIPFIGPLIQMLRCKSGFHLRMRSVCSRTENPSQQLDPRPSLAYTY